MKRNYLILFAFAVLLSLILIVPAYSYTPIGSSGCDSGYDYCAVSSDLSANFKSGIDSGNSIKASRNGYYLSFYPQTLFYSDDENDFQSVSAIQSVAGITDANTILYSGAFGTGRDFNYSYLDTILKENLLINVSGLPSPSISGTNNVIVIRNRLVNTGSFNFDDWIINGAVWDESSDVSTDSKILLQTGGETELVISKPFAYDINTHEVKYGKYRLFKAGPSFFIDVRIPLEWALNQSMVIIDPTISAPLHKTTAWFNDSWAMRQNITIDKDFIGENLYNFTVSVNLNSSNFNFSLAKTDGSDIRFTADNSTALLNYEIEYWNSTEQKAVIWVKVPFISGASDSVIWIDEMPVINEAYNTTIWMYYNNSLASDGQNPSGTWDSNYYVVEHLNQLTGNLTDSTRGYNMSPSASITSENYNAEGKIGKGIYLRNGVFDYFDGEGMDSAIVNQPFTVEFWANPNQTYRSPGFICMLFSWYSDVTSTYYNMMDTCGNAGSGVQDKFSFFIFSSDYSYSNYMFYSSNTYTTDKWYHYVVTFNGTYLKGYIDKVNDLGGSADFVGNESQPTFFQISNIYHDTFYEGTKAQYNGIADEFRFSTIARDEAYVNASFYNVDNQLLTFGLGEGIPVGAPPSSPLCNISANATYENQTMSLDCDLNISSGISLTLNNVSLIMNNALDYQYNINNSGILHMNNGSILANGYRYHVYNYGEWNLTNMNDDNQWNFSTFTGSKLYMKNTNLTNFSIPVSAVGKWVLEGGNDFNTMSGFDTGYFFYLDATITGYTFTDTGNPSFLLFFSNLTLNNINNCRVQMFDYYLASISVNNTVFHGAGTVINYDPNTLTFENSVTDYIIYLYSGTSTIKNSSAIYMVIGAGGFINLTKPYSSFTSVAMAVISGNTTMQGYVDLETFIGSFVSGNQIHRIYPIIVRNASLDILPNTNIYIKKNGIIYDNQTTDSNGFVWLTAVYNETNYNNDFEVWTNQKIGNVTLLLDTKSELLFNESPDVTAPLIAIQKPSGTYTYTEGLQLNYTVSDPNLDKCWYNIDGGSNISLTNCANTTFNITLPLSGLDTSHNIIVYANDTYSNKGEKNVTFQISISQPIVGGGGGGGESLIDLEVYPIEINTVSEMGSKYQIEIFNNGSFNVFVTINVSDAVGQYFLFEPSTMMLSAYEKKIVTITFLGDKDVSVETIIYVSSGTITKQIVFRSRAQTETVVTSNITSLQSFLGGIFTGSGQAVEKSIADAFTEPLFKSSILSIPKYIIPVVVLILMLLYNYFAPKNKKLKWYIWLIAVIILILLMIAIPVVNV